VTALGPDPDVAPYDPGADPAAPPLPRRVRGLQYLWVAGAVLVVAALLHWLGAVLTPFLVAAILAYFGSPAVSWAERRRIPRTLGTLLVMLVILALLLGLLFVLIPLLHSEFTQAVRRLPQLVAQLNNRVAPWLHDTLGVDLQLDMATVRQLISENIESAETLSLKVLSSVKAGGTVVLGILINLALIPVVMFYLLRDWNRIVERVDDLLPRRWLPRVRKIAHEIDRVLAEFLRGQLSVMGVLAVYYAVGLSIAGLQFALPIGILTGLLVFIPYVGFGLGLVLGMLAALLQWSGLPGFLAVVAVYGVGQLLENYVLVPWLVGDRIGLHPLAVIFALLAFGELFGFAGVLLALPVSAALLVGLRHVRAAYLATDLYR
jgi:predicted PurR-regulated permease PerM